MDGLEVLQKIRAQDQHVPVIMITAYATVETSIQALRKGAYDMLTKPFEPEELLYRVRNALHANQLESENRELRQQLAGEGSFAHIIGAESGLKGVIDIVRKVALRDTSVLITGESGTGKEVIAKAIHANSARKEKRFMAINCGALPANVLEGILEASDGGTLFLDEVGNLPMNMQQTLLRFLQEHEFMRLGDTQPIKVDTRIISATNSDLKQAMQDGSFRDDLFYRLNVVNIHLPPLRERRQDLPLLVSHFIRQNNAKFGTSVKGLTPEAMQLVYAFDWPGNIRQMENIIEACMTMLDDGRIELETLQQFLYPDAGVNAHIDTSPHSTASQASVDAEYSLALAEFETEYLRTLLQKTGGNVEEAAKIAGMNMATIYRKLKKYAISKDKFI
jgi:DNA-binding NtrC family response regulator